jgi:hypothetical protein
MPGLVLHVQATITCSHQGRITITPSQTRALVNGMPIATTLDTMVVAGCPGVSPAPPCTTARWTDASARVQASGSPILLQSLPPAGPVPGGGVCVGPPPNIPLVSAMQTRVSGT